jgi:hypothetical protein
VLGPIVHRTPITRGSHPACAVCAPTFVLGAPFCEANDQGPRSGPMAFTVARLCVSFRLAASLDGIAKMPRIRFYNRRFTSRAPVRNTTSGDHPPSAVGNPAGLRLRDPPRPRRFRRSFEEDAGPPRGHPASSSHVLDGTPPASGRPAFTCASARCAFARRTSASIKDCPRFFGNRAASPERAL